MCNDDRAASRIQPLRCAARMCLRFLSATETAVALIMILVFVLALATVLEGMQGRAAVEHFVYHSWWFNSAFLLIGINAAAALLSRFPWRWRQCGFVMTHLGLVVLLVGMAQSSRGGVEGLIAIRIGDRSGEVELARRSELRIRRLDIDPARQVTFSFIEVPLALTTDAFHVGSPTESVGLRIVQFSSAMPTDSSLTRMPARSGASSESSALIEVRANDDVQRVWLERDGEGGMIQVGNGSLLLELARQRRALGFSVELREIRRASNPGGSGEAPCISTIRFHDSRSREVAENEVAVNQPATYRGFKFYQLDGQERAEGASEVLLGVTRDPGWLLKYLGVTTICLGMILAIIVNISTRGEIGA